MEEEIGYEETNDDAVKFHFSAGEMGDIVIDIYEKKLLADFKVCDLDWVNENPPKILTGKQYADMYYNPYDVSLRFLIVLDENKIYEFEISSETLMKCFMEKNCAFTGIQLTQKEN